MAASEIVLRKSYFVLLLVSSTFEVSTALVFVKGSVSTALMFAITTVLAMLASVALWPELFLALLVKFFEEVVFTYFIDGHIQGAT